MMFRQTSIIVASILLLGEQAVAGPVLEKAKAEAEAYADTAGYVLSTVPFCGGSASEQDYFLDLVGRMLTKIGADAADVAFVQTRMREVEANSEPRGVHCTDEGALQLSGKLEDQRQAIIKAVSK